MARTEIGVRRLASLLGRAVGNRAVLARAAGTGATEQWHHWHGLFAVVRARAIGSPLCRPKCRLLAFLSLLACAGDLRRHRGELASPLFQRPDDTPLIDVVALNTAIGRSAQRRLSAGQWRRQPNCSATFSAMAREEVRPGLSMP